MTESKNTNAQLLAENETLRQRLATLEGLPANESLTQLEHPAVFYSEMLKNLSEGIFVVRIADGIILYGNPQMHRMFGYVPGELVGHHVSIVNAQTAQSPEETANEIMTSIKENGTWKGEILNIRKDGIEFWNSVDISAFEHSEYGSVFISIHVDITDLKRAEEQLRESEMKFRNLVEGSQQGIMVQRNHKPLYANQAYAAMHGYDSPEEVVALGDTLSLRAPHERARTIEYVNAWMRGEYAPSSYEVEDLRKDGSTMWVNSLNRIIEWDGQPAIQATYLDITDHKLAQQSQQITQQYLDSIIFNMPVGVAILEGPELIYYRINQHLADLNGIPVEDHLGRPLAEVLPHAMESIIPHMRAVIETGVPIIAREFSMNVPKDPNNPVYLMDWLFPIKNPEGHSTAIGALVLDITDRKRSEEALQQSEADYRHLFESASDSIFVIDPESHRFLDVNEIAAKRLGYEPSEIVGMTMEEIRPEAARNTVPDNLAVTLRNGTSRREGVHLHRDGSTFPVEISSRVTSYSNRAVILSFVRDITERKWAEKQLRSSEQRYRNLIEGSIQGIIIQRDQKAIFVNRAFAEIFGYETPEEILELETLDTLISDEFRIVMRSYANIRLQKSQEDAPSHYESLGVQKDGTLIWTDNVVRVVDWDGDDAIQTTLIDITKHKLSGVALRQSEERYRDLVEGSIQGIMVHRDTKILFANNSYAHIFGYDSADEILALRSTQDLEAKHETERLEKIYRAQMREDEPHTEFEFEGLKKDDSAVWLTNTVRLVNWDGELATQTVTIDITGQKRLQDHLVTLNENLESQVDVRTASLKLAHDNLKITHRHIRSLSHRMRNSEESERRRIAGELHDEIGQYLTALKIHLQAMQLRPKIEDATDRLKACLEIAEILLQRVRNLALDLRPANLDDLGLSAALRWLIDQQAEVGGFACQLSVDRVPDRLPKDVATACFRVVQEALTNVVRHAGAAHVRVELQYFGDVIQFSIRDDGKGFDTSKATMRALAGESIGLLGMQERVELSGGQFEINSTIGKGTTIRATISLDSTKPV